MVAIMEELQPRNDRRAALHVHAGRTGNTQAMEQNITLPGSCGSSVTIQSLFFTVVLSFALLPPKHNPSLAVPTSADVISRTTPRCGRF